MCCICRTWERTRDAKVHKFLFDLDEVRFNGIRSQIIDEEPLPDLNIVYSQVIRAEQNINNLCGKTQLASPSSQTEHLHLSMLQQSFLEAVILLALVLTANVHDMKLQSVFYYMVTRSGSLRNNNNMVLGMLQVFATLILGDEVVVVQTLRLPPSVLHLLLLLHLIKLQLSSVYFIHNKPKYLLIVCLVKPNSLVLL